MIKLLSLYIHTIPYPAKPILPYERVIFCPYPFFQYSPQIPSTDMPLEVVIIYSEIIEITIICQNRFSTK